MKHLTFVLFVIILTTTLEAQSAVNLVPNPSFEKYDTCPYNTGQIYFAKPWFQPNIASGNTTNTSSSDYYNACSPSAFPSLSTPGNIAGFQIARTGQGYAGIGLVGGPNNPAEGGEYLEVQLDSFLLTGKRYCVNYYVSCANGSVQGTDGIGSFFSNNILLYNDPNWANLNEITQVENPIGNVLTDTINWHCIHGIFRASGGERFMTIGDFLLGSQIHFKLINQNGWESPYYYIDDIAVKRAPEAISGSNQNLCSADSLQLGGAKEISGYSYSWFPTQGLSNPNVPSPKALPYQNTTYRLIVSDNSCQYCSDTSYVHITVCDSLFLFRLPNVFSPNNDGINDEFVITLVGAKQFKLQIIDRWGIKVFESNQVEKSWDGRTLTGIPCLAGTYYYILRAIDTRDSLQQKQGFLELIR
jgi:gliding motility-associated-like protein